jgi:hypothetical protein
MKIKRYGTRKNSIIILSAARLASIGLLIATTATIAFAITYSGTNFGEVLPGTPVGDTIHGRGGDDRILGLEGNDKLYGDSGDDALTGGPGREITLTVEQERTLLQTIVGHLEIVKHQTVKGSNRLISPFSFFSRYHYSSLSLSLCERKCNISSLLFCIQSA